MADQSNLTKIPLEKIYGRSFFSRRYKLNWRAPMVVGSLCAAFDLQDGYDCTVIDVGCAQGDIVHCFNTMTQTKAWGLEGSPAAIEYLECSPDVVIMHDLREPLNVGEKFTLSICLEVAEHIEPKYADTFVDTLCSLSDQVVLSAATPGQGGHYHVNCRPYSFWIDKFSARGYSHQIEIEEALKHYLSPWKHKPGIKAYYHNILVFIKEG